MLRKPFAPSDPSPLPLQQRPWVSLVVSTLVHGLVVILAVALTRQPPERPAEDPARREAERRRQVELMYLPPPPCRPPPPRPPPAPRPPPPVTPPPPARQPDPEPAPNAPPDAKRSPGVGEPERGTSRASTPAPAPAPAPTAEAAPTIESEAQRIFGRPRLGPPPGAGPLATRPMESDITPTKCVPKPKPPRDPAAAPQQLGTVVGRIFRRDDGRPLPGAFLQMIGTPYVTFTDDDGMYRFKFDLSLVDDCRTQFVRVTAKGYQSQLLVLVVGENVQNENIMLRRR